MPRLLFEKTGNAVWISHLDLMRLLQRAFKRADLPLTHSHGFTPRPQVSIALPLSVGVESQCEILDFDLDGELPDADYIRDALNAALIDGVKVLQVYNDGRKIKYLSLLSCVVTLEYDNGIPEGCQQAISDLFHCSASVVVEKHTKKGPVQQDILPMIRRLAVVAADEHTLELQALVCCQNPSLNPMQLVAAIERYLPAFRPDFAKSRRLEVYDETETIFR